MSSYKSIIKSSGIIGLVQIFQILFGLIRNKAIAVVVGTKGFGVWGLYQTYIEMVTAFSSLGIDKSGIREIAKNSEDVNLTAKCIYVFRRSLILISLFTATLSILFSKRISNSLFNTEEHYWGIIIVSFVILFNGISSGQISILNGLRDLKGLAISQIIGSSIGSIATIILVLLLGIDGIPIYLFIVGLTAVLSTWFFVRKLHLPTVIPTKKEAQQTLKSLISLGLGFSIAGIIAALTTYLSRVYLSHAFDLNAVGIYQASWTISNLYIGIILTAMGVDFMPRLMKVAGNDFEMNVLVNEQMELGTLVTGIAIVAILIFSPLILQLLYSKEFIVGASIIRWQVLGVGMRVLGFPFSYAIMAKNKPYTYIFVQSIIWFSDYFLLILFSKLIGFNGLGINYFVAYILYILVTWYVCFKLFHFSPSNLLKKIVTISYSFIFIVWAITSFLSEIYCWLFGSIIILIMAFWINNMLKKQMNISVVLILKNKLIGK